MFNYVNSFSLSTSDDKTKVVVHLGQNYPDPFSEEDDSIENEIITSVILDADTAIALSACILDNLDQLEHVDDEDASSNE